MIPNFDIHGVIPPIRPIADGHSADRAPYATDMLSFCQSFGESPERAAILKGLLDLRQALATAGIVEGFQWINGSFVEDVERLRGRPLEDIDVVTLASLGKTAAQQRAKVAQWPKLFLNNACKADFRVNHYLIGTDRFLDHSMGHRVAYWYSMWAHQRDTHRWKGFVSVPLQSNDAEARAWLHLQHPVIGGTP